MAVYERLLLGLTGFLRPGYIADNETVLVFSHSEIHHAVKSRYLLRSGSSSEQNLEMWFVLRVILIFGHFSPSA